MKQDAKTWTAAEIDAFASDWVVRREAGLSASEATEFEAWQSADPRHAAAIRRHEKAWAMLDLPRSGGRAAELDRALVVRKRRRQTRRLAGAAVCALVLGTMSVLWRDQRPTLPTAPATTAVVRAPETRTLADGSVIELKPGTVAHVDYNESRRSVDLQSGEALFRVAKDAARPFVVTAGVAQVRAIGTEFLVELNGAALDVIVTEGTVAVERTAAPAGAARSRDATFSAQLTAGRRATLDPAKTSGAPTIASISPEEIAERLLWRSPRLVFSDTPLAEALSLVNRDAPIQLRIEDMALGALPVTGVVRAGNTEALIRLLEANFDVQAERTPEAITLRKKR